MAGLRDIATDGGVEAAITDSVLRIAPDCRTGKDDTFLGGERIKFELSASLGPLDRIRFRCGLKYGAVLLSASSSSELSSLSFECFLPDADTPIGPYTSARGDRACVNGDEGAIGRLSSSAIAARIGDLEVATLGGIFSIDERGIVIDRCKPVDEAANVSPRSRAFCSVPLGATRLSILGGDVTAGPTRTIPIPVI